MASSNLESSEEKTYGWKLMRLIVDGGTEALRNIFLNIHPGNLQHVLITHYSTLHPLYNPRRIITQLQWDKLYPHSPPPRIPNIEEFDITLLVILLRNICSLPAPSTGWNARPAETDRSKEANIVRIKLFRNNFFGHVPCTAVSSFDFEARWIQVSSTLVDLGLSQVEIDRLKAEECGEEEVSRVWEKWNESERESVLKLERIELKLDQLEKTLEEVRTLSHESSQQENSSSDNILSERLHWCDFQNEIQLLLKRYTKGTRQWVFEQVLTWLDNKSSTNRAFIIAGQAGMGKSVIAAVICKLFSENFAACHFFQHNNSRYNNSKFLLQSLAWQLSNVVPVYKKELTTNLSGCKGQILNDMNIEGLFSMLFEESFPTSISEQCTPFLIVIDALDECRQEERYELVDLITTHFNKLPSYIRFLITTRSEKDIARKFHNLNPIFLEPDEARNLNDLRVYFRNSITIKTEKLVESLLKRSEGLMLYASFIAKLIEDNFSISNTETLPKGIEEIYESYFKRLEKDMKKLGIGEDKFSSLLGIVAVAKQALPLSFIEKLLCPKKDSLSARRMLLKLISCISSLLVVRDDLISIFHKSVKDWLVKPDHYFTIIERHGHEMLAVICINQLNTLKQNDVRFTHDPAINYALQHVIAHILEAEVEDEHSLAELIDPVIDLEIVHYSLCIDFDTTLKNFVCLTSWNIYNSLGEEMRVRIKILTWIIRKFNYILKDAPQSFLAHIANEIKELSTEASTLLMTRYKGLAYFESDNVKGTALVGRILTERKILEVDISPSEDFVICEYEEKGIELFSLSDFKSLWKIDDFVVERNHAYYRCNIVPRRIVFHPFLNIIFPGQLNPVLNLKGKYESGPLTCEKIPTKFKRCCFSNDHTKMVTNNGSNLIVWKLRDNEKIVTLPCNSFLYSILFSGNDRYLATTESSSFKVYDTENSYSMISRGCGRIPEVVVSTYKLDSWYCWKVNEEKGNIVRYDLTSQRVHTNFLSLPRKARAAVEFQKIMENETPMWFQKLGSRGNFFILENGSVLFFKNDDYQLRLFEFNELVKGSTLKQEYDKCTMTESLFFLEENALISVDGRYIYTSSPYVECNNTMLSSVQPGISRKVLRIKYTPFLPVTNGVFAMKVKRNPVEFEGGTPELWNADLTERLFIFSELSGTFHCLSVTENLVACIMMSEVRFFDVEKKQIVASTQLPQYNSSDLPKCSHRVNVIACGSQYHVVYKKDNSILLLQKTNVVNLSEFVLNSLKPTKKHVSTACFSLSGRLLAFPSDNMKIIHILDISVCKNRCDISLGDTEARKLEFIDEEHLLCKGYRAFLILVNAKTGEILTSISVGVDFEWCFSVCRKKGDIVVFDSEYKTFKLLKLWLSDQRRDDNDLLNSCSQTNA